MNKNVNPTTNSTPSSEEEASHPNVEEDVEEAQPSAVANNKNGQHPAQRLRQKWHDKEAAEEDQDPMTGVHWGIPLNADAEKHVSKVHGADSWQYKILKKLHSHKIQLLGMGLLILDVLIMFTELFLRANYPECRIIERDGLSCCPIADAAAGHRWMSSSSDLTCSDDSLQATDYEATCDPHKHQAVHTAEQVFFGLSVAILAYFCVELHLEMMALTPCVFFQQILLALDYIVVTLSLAAEVAFFFLNSSFVQSYVSILILIRLWRFVRIGHGIMEVTHELKHHRIESMLAYAEALEDLLDEHGIAIPDTTRSLLGNSTGSTRASLLEAITKGKRDKMREKAASGGGAH